MKLMIHASKVRALTKKSLICWEEMIQTLREETMMKVALIWPSVTNAAGISLFKG